MIPVSQLKQLHDEGHPVVVALGLGTDSVSMVCRMVREGLPIDRIQFADTGAELPHTYDYLPAFDAWLKAKGYPGVTVVYQTHRRPSAEAKARGIKRGDRVTIQDAMWENATVPPPAFGFHSCSIRFKIVPCDDDLKTWPMAREALKRGKRVVKLIGFEAGEDHRVTRCSPYQDSATALLCFPLRDWGMDRDACRLEIHRAGLPQPGKSACYFCPNRKVAEIVEMAKLYPEFAQRALALEARAQASGKLKGTEAFASLYPDLVERYQRGSKAGQLKGTRGLARENTWAEILAEEGVAV